MRSKQVTISAKLTEKNRVYLSKLGFIDNRNGKIRNTRKSLSEFVNQCVSLVCESGMSPQNDLACDEELRVAWAKYLIREKAAEIDRVVNEMRALKREFNMENVEIIR